MGTRGKVEGRAGAAHSSCQLRLREAELREAGLRQELKKTQEEAGEALMRRAVEHTTDNMQAAADLHALANLLERCLPWVVMSQDGRQMAHEVRVRIAQVREAKPFSEVQKLIREQVGRLEQLEGELRELRQAVGRPLLP